MYCEAKKILASHEDAEDAVQEAFIILHDHLDGLKNIEGDGTRCYVVRVAKNVALNMRRKRNRKKIVPLDELPYEVPGVDETVFERTEVEVILTLLFTSGAPMPANAADTNPDAFSCAPQVVHVAPGESTVMMLSSLPDGDGLTAPVTVGEWFSSDPSVAVLGAQKVSSDGRQQELRVRGLAPGRAVISMMVEITV